MYKLIVAGGRDFNDYELLKEAVETIVSVHIKDKITILSGMARGADALAYMYAHKHNIPCEEYYANWDKHGKSAGYKRNEEMGKRANGLIAFWDGKSKGTKHMIDFMLSNGKEVCVVEY